MDRGLVIRRALALALLALVAAPAAASAHATLVGTVPARGARLQRAPAQVELRFDEPVETAFGSLKVFDPAGRQVQAGEAFHPGGRGTNVAVELQPGLKDGTYTAVFRVISDDGHPLTSGFVFSVGDGAPATKSVDALLAGGTGPITSSAFAVVRAIQYGAIALSLGALAFLLLCWLPGLRAVAGGEPAWQDASDAFAFGTQRIIVAACFAGLLSGAAALVLQGAVGEGSTFWAAAKPDVVHEVLGTRFGTAWGLAALGWALALIALAVQRPLPRLQPASVGATGLALPSPRLLALAVPLVALAFLPALGGHASVKSPVPLLLPANVLHVLAMSAWLGGIAVLVLALGAATSRLEPGDRGRLLSAVVARFSTLAGIAIAVLLHDRRGAGHRRGAHVRASARHRVRPRRPDQGGRRARHRVARLRQPAAAAARAAPLRHAGPRRACCCGGRCGPSSRSAPSRSPSPGRCRPTRRRSIDGSAEQPRADRREQERDDRPAGAEGREDGQHEADRAEHAERPAGEHEAVRALLALLAGRPGSLASLDVAHASDDATPTRARAHELFT